MLAAKSEHRMLSVVARNLFRVTVVPSSCYVAAPGTFNPDAGGQSLAACRSSPRGMHTSTAGAETPIECSPGATKHFGCGPPAQSCAPFWRTPLYPFDPFPTGRYQRSEGMTKCDLCPAGEFSSAPGAVICQPCGTGQHSEIGSSSCQMCAEAYYRLSADSPT
eukprot:466938-Prymnesium_polylepis.2